MEKVTISKDLLHKILVYFGREMEPGREHLTDDAPESVIYDALFYDEFPEEKLSRLFPGEFDFTDE